MWPDNPYANPVSSFAVPVPVPLAGPGVGTCVDVRLSSAWIPYIIGSLKQLWLQSTWLTADPDILSITQARVTELMALFTTAPEVDCLEVVTNQLRVQNCVLQSSVNGIDWINLVDLTTCGTPGPPGGPGSGGLPIGAPQTNAINTTPTAVACGVTSWALSQINDRWHDALDILQAGIDIAAPGARIATDLINMAAQFTIIGDEALLAATELVVGAAQSTLDAIITADTADFQDYIRCSLFCLLDPRGGDFGETLESVVRVWQNDMIANQNPVVSVPYAAFLSLFDINFYRKLARIGQNNAGECDDCTNCPEVGSWTYDKNWLTNNPLSHWYATVIGGNGAWFPDYEGGYWGGGVGNNRQISMFLQWDDTQLRVIDSIDIQFHCESFQSLALTGRRPGYPNSFEVSDTATEIGHNGVVNIHLVCGGEPVAYVDLDLIGLGGGPTIIQKIEINGSGGQLPTVWVH